MRSPVRLEHQASVSHHQHAMETFALAAYVPDHPAEEVRVHTLLLGSRYARCLRPKQIRPASRAPTPCADRARSQRTGHHGENQTDRNAHATSCGTSKAANDLGRLGRASMVSLGSVCHSACRSATALACL